MIDYEVFRGPGDQIVAISTQPSKGNWTVKKGTQGSRLRLSQWPTTKYPVIDRLKADILSPDYTWLFTGHVDVHGNPTHIASAAVIFWNIEDAFIPRLRHDLLTLVKDMRACGVVLNVVDDAIGLVISGPQWQFGVTARTTPNCVSTHTKSGAGEVVLSASPELLVVLCALSCDHKFCLADKTGSSLTVAGAMELGGRFISDNLANFVKQRGLAPLSVYVRNTGRPQVRF